MNDIIVSDGIQDCGECNLCCKLLETHDVPSPIGEYCKLCTDQGCSIYEERPNECREYQCMWTQMPKQYARIEMRPDQCGIIFDKQSDNVITARLEEDRKISQLVMGQIQSFMREGYSILVFRGKENKLFKQEHHTEEYIKGFCR